MQDNRFKGYTKDIKNLVQGFERMLRHGEHHYYDLEQLEVVIDYYLDIRDAEMLEQSVCYAESLFPGAVAIRLRRCHLLCFNEQYEQALVQLRQLEGLEPDNTDVHYALGTVYGALDQPRRAIQHYRRAAADGCRLDLIYGNIADEYAHLGQYDEAIQYYRKSLDESPDEERSIANLVSCYENAERYDEAVAFYRQFVADHPYAKTAWFCLGTIYFALQLYERAADAFEYAIAIDKHYVLAYISLAGTYSLTGQSAKAVETLRDSLNYVDEKSIIYFNIATVFLSARNYHTAALYLRKSVADDPYFAEAWENLGICYGEMDDYQGAIEAAMRAVETNPQSADFLRTAARIHERFGHLAEAEPLYACSAKLAGDGCDDYWLCYADCLLKGERYDDVVELLQSCLPKCQEPLPFNQRLAVCFFRTGRRSSLLNAVRACIHDDINAIHDLFLLCPEMEQDAEVLNLITTYRNEL